MAKVDIVENRKTRSWTRREQAVRVAWGLARPFFAWSPRVLWGWRRWLLRCFGAKVGREVHIHPSVQITIPWHLELGDHCAVGDRAVLYALGRIFIGARATVSQGAHICAGTHDLNQASRPLLKIPIKIESDVWIAADAFVGPGVTIGCGAVVGARSVVFKDVNPGVTVVGNPAFVIGGR